VVGRFVEQQDVRAGKEDTQEFHPPPLPAGQGGQRPVEEVVGDAQPGRQTAGLALGAVAAGHAEGLLAWLKAAMFRADGSSSMARRSFSISNDVLGQAPAREDMAEGRGVGRPRRSRRGPGEVPTPPLICTRPLAWRSHRPALLIRLVLPRPVAADDTDLLPGSHVERDALTSVTPPTATDRFLTCKHERHQAFTEERSTWFQRSVRRGCDGLAFASSASLGQAWPDGVSISFSGLAVGSHRSR